MGNKLNVDEGDSAASEARRADFALMAARATGGDSSNSSIPNNKVTSSSQAASVFLLGGAGTLFVDILSIGLTARLAAPSPGIISLLTGK